jgi:Tfp pilus assembly protein PilF
METNRVDVLKNLVSQRPADTFARYGLAMEYVKSGALEQAVAEFRAVLATDPEYAYAYFHGGQTLEKLGLFDEARQMYETGIEVTQRKGDHKATSELQAALDLLPL